MMPLTEQIFTAGLATLVQEQRIGVVSYFSLASGFLTGKYGSLEDVKGSARADFPQGYFSERGQRLLKELLAVSNELPARPAQVALAWLLNQPGVTAPIASATSLAQLDEILDSITLTLPELLLSRLEEASRTTE